MLAPVSEAEFGERALLELGLESAAPLRGVLRASSTIPATARSGTLVVARDRDEAEALDRLAAFRAGLGLPVERLRPSQARALEPALAPTSGSRSTSPATTRSTRASSSPRCARAFAGEQPRAASSGARASRASASPASSPTAATISRRRRRRRRRRATSRGSRCPSTRACRCGRSRASGAAAARSDGPAWSSARSAASTRTSSRAATGATCSARRWRSAAGTRRRPPAASTSCCATSSELVPGVFELEIEELIAGPASGDAGQPAGDRPGRARGPGLGDRPLPQRHPAHAGHGRPRGRRAGRRAAARTGRRPPTRCASRGCRHEGRPERRADAELDDGATVAAALDVARPAGAGRGVAVAVDAEVVPRGEWAQTELHEGARVEILRAIQGG